MLPKTRVFKKWQLILKLSWFLGLVETERPSRWRKTYMAFLTLVHVICYFYSLGRFITVFDHFLFVLKFAEQISMILLALSCILVTVWSGFLYPEELGRIIENLEKFDHNFGDKTVNETSGKSYYVAPLLRLLTTVIILIIEFLIWIDYAGIAVYQFYIGRNFQILIVGIANFVQYNFIKEISTRFFFIKARLEDVCVKSLEAKSTPNKQIAFEAEAVTKIKNICKLHNCLCDTLDKINKLYGFNLVFDTLFATGFSIFYTAMMMFYSFLSTGERHPVFGTNLKIIGFLWLTEFSVSIATNVLRYFHMKIDSHSLY